MKIIKRVASLQHKKTQKVYPVSYLVAQNCCKDKTNDQIHCRTSFINIFQDQNHIPKFYQSYGIRVMYLVTKNGGSKLIETLNKLPNKTLLSNKLP